MAAWTGQVAAIYAKLDRADEHLKALTSEIGVYVDSEPHAYTVQLDLDAGRYSVRIAIERPPPQRIAVICGDFVPNLRSALDYLICGFVPKITRRTCFPIYGDPDEFLCRVILPARRKERGPLSGLDPSGELFASVERYQPYNGPRGIDHHPLWLLAELSNADKHRSILTLASAHNQSRDLNVQWEGLAFVGKAKFVYDRPLEDGTEVLSGAFVLIPGSEPNVKVYGHLPIDIAFGDGLVTSHGLNDIRKAVWGITNSVVQTLT